MQFEQTRCLVPRPIFKLLNDKALVAKLQDLEKKAFKTIEKKVIRAGATPIAKGIRRNMPVDSGAAKKSIGIKVTRKGRAVIGADAEYKLGDKQPAKYIHLIEFGHANTDGSVTPGIHPIERGAKDAEGESAQKMNDKASTELNKLL